MWKRVGEISNTSGDAEDRMSKGKGKRRKKGFGFYSQEYRVRPGNCTVGRLMSDSRFSEAVLSFLESTQVGSVKKGVIIRGEEAG